MNKHILKIILALNFIIIAVPLFAFPGDPEGGDDPPFEDPMPIDSNSGILIFVVICLAFALIRNSGKRRMDYHS